MKTTIAILALLFVAPPSLFGADFEPVIPQRGAPVLLDFAKFPVAKWKSLSDTNFSWFVETPKGWCIDWDCERGPIEYLIIHHT